MNLSNVISDFLIAKEIEEGCSLNTIKTYKYDLEYVKKTLGNIDISKIKIYAIRNILRNFYEKKYSKVTIARKIACFKSFFKFCTVNELIDKNPMSVIRSPKIRGEESLPKFLEIEEMKEIFNILINPPFKPPQSYTRLYIIIRLLYSSMTRVSELCNLLIKDINFENNSIKVRGKGNKERYIPIDFQTSQLIKKYIEKRFKDLVFLEQLEEKNNDWKDDFKITPVFINSRGNPITPRIIQKDIQNLKQYLSFGKKKKITPHIFRHTGATHLRQNGMDISELQDILGHSSPNTTRIYAKNDLTRLRQSYFDTHPLAMNKNK